MNEEQQQGDELERILQEAADELYLQPSSVVWEQVTDQLHPSAKKFPYWIAAAASFLLLTGGYFIWHPFAPKPVTMHDKTFTAVPAQQISSTPSSNPDNVSGSNATATPSASEQKKEATTAQASYAGSSTASRNALTGAAQSYVAQPSAASPSSEEIRTNAATESATSQGAYQTTPAEASDENVKTGVLPQPTGPTSTALPAAAQEDAGSALNANLSVTKKASQSHKWSWEAYVVPALSYRSFHFSNIKEGSGSNNNYMTSSFTSIHPDTTTVYHSPSVGLGVGFYLSRSIGKRMSLSMGIRVDKMEYKISALRAYPSSQDYNRIQSMASSAPPRGLSSNASLSNTYKSVTLHNKYLQLNIPLVINWEHPLGSSLQLELNGGISGSYLLHDHIHIFSPGSGHYFKDPDLIRHWNSDLELGAALRFPVGAKWDMDIGPMLQYQLLSTYPQDFDVKEHPYNAGIKIGLMKKK
jgi:hypothetical protein